MRITGIKVVSDILPCGGRDYCVARITGTKGDLPEELQQLIYPDGKERLTDIEGIPDTSPWSRMAAAYIFVERVSMTEDNFQNFRVMDSMNDFLTPFEFEEPLKDQFVEFYFNTRAQQAEITMTGFDLDDEDEDGNLIIKKSFLFYSLAEKSYILSEVNEVDELMMSMERERFALTKNHSGVNMIFAQALEKGVNIYNDINFHKKAKEIADQISQIIYIDDMGNKSHLNVTAVENFLSNIKDNIRISSPVPERVVPIEPVMASDEQEEKVPTNTTQTAAE